jgi:hypothetical protein
MQASSAHPDRGRRKARSGGRRRREASPVAINRMPPCLSVQETAKRRYIVEAIEA